MNFKYTACLASLLMASPFVAPAVSGAAGWEYESFINSWYYGKEEGSGVVDSSNNHVTSLPAGYVSTDTINIGYANGIESGTANGNTFTYTGGKFATIRVGNAVGENAQANENKIVLTDAEVTGTICFGEAGCGPTATANGNTIELNGGTYGTVDGDYPDLDFIWPVVSLGKSTSAELTGNTVILKGGTYNTRIISASMAYIDKSSSKIPVATNNTVELHAGADSQAPVFHDKTLIAGFYSDTKEGNPNRGTMAGNTLKFCDVKGMTAGNIQNFQKLVFDYREMHAGDVILKLTGVSYPKSGYFYPYETGGEQTIGVNSSTNITNAEVTVGVASLYGKDGGEFKIGDKVVLLKNDNGLVTDGIKTKATITAQTGISLTYDVEIQENKEGTELFLTRTGTVDPDSRDDGRDDGKDDGKDDGTTVLPGTKSIAEGAAAGLALACEAANASIELLHDFSLIEGTVTPFVHVQASSMRHEAGSSINVSAVSLMAGLGTGIDTGAGKISAAAFFEYGKGSYTTHNSFDSRSDIDGDGNSWYMGGGILARMDFVPAGPGHFYLEGSAHMGTLHNEYDSNDLYDASGRVANFDMDSPYYSLHGGLGYVWNMAEGHDLDIYGKYIWTRVQGTDDTLTTGDRFEYDDMDSNRVRFGVRYSYKGSERFSPYVGAAFEHEFSGSCDSRAFGYSVAAPSFEGSSGMGELGLMMKPTESLPLSINLGVQGYVGQKQGISGNCVVMYEF